MAYYHCFLKEDGDEAYEDFLVWICFRRWLDDCVCFDDLFYLLMMGMCCVFGRFCIDRIAVVRVGEVGYFV